MRSTPGASAAASAVSDWKKRLSKTNGASHLTGASGGGRAVDVQVTRLRRKIEQNPKLPRYLRTVRGKGYVLRPD